LTVLHEVASTTCFGPPSIPDIGKAQLLPGVLRFLLSQEVFGLRPMTQTVPKMDYFS
jgi:hypothetical protein